MANIDLITGFLGAGKTTFIRKYAAYLKSKGEKIAVIENEYGSKGIDSQILMADGIVTDELYGGCICCTLKIGFHDMLLRLSKDYDRVIVEPSGVYDISQFYSVMSGTAMEGKCSVGNVICIVDPYSLSDMDDFSRDMLRRQVRSSGAVIFSMNDGADYECIAGYKKALSESLNIESFNVIGYTDLDSAYKVGKGSILFDAETSHSGRYLSTTVKPEPCDPESIKRRIEVLFMTDCVGEVLRVKGVWNGYIINAISGKTDIERTEGSDGLNIIGINIKRKEIMKILNGQN